jgi:hypothetical protein
MKRSMSAVASARRPSVLLKYVQTGELMSVRGKHWTFQTICNQSFTEDRQCETLCLDPFSFHFLVSEGDHDSDGC